VSKYERILDNDRINKHEILNNLLILKSFKNKNTKEYEETLNLIIKEYENKDKNLFVNLYNLPAGLKGLLYYKVYEMKNFNINVFLNISNKVIPKLEKIDSKNFAKLCKILGIVLDNAKEASENSEDKNIAIDIYKENKKIVIYVENSTKNDVEISKIYEKNYSTKGKDRGLGLYIAKEIVNNSVIFELEQFINESKNFVSIITII
jgi:two-component system sensor histidine kinase AgrC